MTFKMTIQGPETWPVDIFFLFFAIAFCYLVAAAAAAAASSQPLRAVFFPSFLAAIGAESG